ncbi:MAG TPA: alpha/beta hydrolase, partial [Chryseosolibacter sp.]|nr:alpha/beta hydrolase [Chryseosolibacter sp.]
RFEFENPETKSKETVEITKGVAMLSLRLSLMALSSSKNIHHVISQANHQNYEPLANIVLNNKKAYMRASYDALTLCVICFEDYPKLLELNKASTGFLGTYWMDRIKNACRIWNAEGWGAPKIAATKQKTPVLLISGNRDGATPPQYGEEVMKFFPNGRHVIVQQGSHSFDGMRNCVEKLICDFVISGNGSSLNDDCVESIKFPAYKLK